ncbi:MAG: right-handed parallel beta-helix repeat-containing protein [Planctomycetota bacterium]
MVKKMGFAVIFICMVIMFCSCGADDKKPAPTAVFLAEPVSGNAPLTVHFTDASTGSISNREWDFNNDGTVDSTDTNPSFTYNSAGTYSVKLKAIGPGGSNEELKIDYIVVETAVPLNADFSATPRSGELPLVVNFTDESDGNVTSWTWDFNNDGTTDSNEQNPSWTYDTAGFYSVSLTITGTTGSDTCLKQQYIVAANNIWYVDDSVTESGDGSSAEEAFKTIQEGLDAAPDYDLVLVADGIYSGLENRNLNFNGKLIHLRSINGSSGCEIDCQYAGRGFVFENGETNDAIIDGFTIRNASVEGDPYGLGGGIYCDASSPTIVNCTISGNSAMRGAGIFLTTSSAVFSNCVITNNICEVNGGGVYFDFNSNATMTNCMISNNTATMGTGIFIEESSPIIKNCIISNNTSTNEYGSGDGAGICCFTNGNATIINCSITNNMSDYGGGMSIYAAAPVITNCTIVDNSALEYGGGVYYYGENNGTIINNSVIWGNTVGGAGNQIFADSALTLNNCNYSTNATDVAGEGTITANSCIHSDPLFINPANLNFRLQISSPCIDSGNNTYLPVDVTTDLDGNDRIVNTTVDIGAYENQE